MIPYEPALAMIKARAFSESESLHVCMFLCVSVSAYVCVSLCEVRQFGAELKADKIRSVNL